MALRKWFDVEAIQAISRHLSAVLPAYISFKIVAEVAEWALPEGRLKNMLGRVDEFILFCVVLYFAIEVLFFLIARIRKHYGGENCLVVA